MAMNRIRISRKVRAKGLAALKLKKVSFKTKLRGKR